MRKSYEGSVGRDKEEADPLKSALETVENPISPDKIPDESEHQFKDEYFKYLSFKQVFPHTSSFIL